jgi:hypothetical protein
MLVVPNQLVITQKTKAYKSMELVICKRGETIDTKFRASASAGALIFCPKKPNTSKEIQGRKYRAAMQFITG